MQIHQSAEDYLETILMLSQRMGKVRSIDVVNELGFTKASVSIAMKKLRENGYIAVDGEGTLTPPSLNASLWVDDLPLIVLRPLLGETPLNDILGRIAIKGGVRFGSDGKTPQTPQEFAGTCRGSTPSSPWSGQTRP